MQKWLTHYSAYTGLIIRPTLIYNRNQRYWQCSVWAQGNTLWMNVDLCQPAFTFHQYTTAVENSERWVAAETNFSSSSSRPPGDAEREQLLFRAGTKSPTWAASWSLCEALVSRVSHSTDYNLGFIDLCISPHINAGQCYCSLFIRWWLLIPLHHLVS